MIYFEDLPGIFLFLSFSIIALPNSSANATAASFPEGSIIPYSNSSTVYSCLNLRFADELLTLDTYLEILMIWDNDNIFLFIDLITT